MKSSEVIVRRATLDDVPALLELWKTMRFPGAELARKVTDFQVVVDARGGLIGTLAMEILGKQGRLHSESFVDFSWADAYRPLLWDRFMTLAANQGVTRVWTREQAAFYRQNDLVRPEADLLKTLPKEWLDGTGEWFTLKLRDDLDTIAKADHEFAMFMAAEKERTGRALQRAKAMKILATLIALALFALVFAGVVYLARRGQFFSR